MLTSRTKMLEIQKMETTKNEYATLAAQTLNAHPCHPCRIANRAFDPDCVVRLMPKIDRDQAKAEMGAWIADYFDDAGYQDWEKMSTLYKSMLMNAFPPVDPLDDVKPDYSKMPIDKFEDALMKFLAVMDAHLAIEKNRNLSKIPGKFYAGLMQRR